MRLRHLALIVLALLAAACSGDDGASDAVSTTTAADATTTTTTPADADPLVVETDAGTVRGGPSAVDGVRHFLAVPYAEAPVGDLAWRPPVPRQPWTDLLDATEGGPACPQTTEGVTAQFVITPEPEPDCLDLDVWTPDGAQDLPVMVWIHGGSFATGSAHNPYYAGDDLAAEGVVVVGINYRLGPQGFLATPQLQDEQAGGAVGNYGFLDQQLALEWVRDNIERFGGDPENVTIFGESAGGFSVCGHLAAPGSQGLFAKAVVQSGGGCRSLTPLDEALAAGVRFMDELGCDDLACLRGASDEELLAVGGFDPALVADGVTLTTPALEQAEAGAFDDLPVLLGSNADEATLFTLSLEEPTDDGLLDLAGRFTDDAAALVDLYPVADFGSNKERFQAMFTDVVFTCPSMAFADAAPQAFLYHFTHVSAQDPFGLGATHGAEIAYLFAHPEGLAIEAQQTDETRQLSELIQAAWAGFAATGDPGDDFDRYDDTGLITILDLPFEQAHQIRGGRCAEVNELVRAAS